MTKEEKLIELGYKRTLNYMVEYIKFYKQGKFTIEIYVRSDNKFVGCVTSLYRFEKQQDIDELQEAYNILQQDLEALEQ